MATNAYSTEMFHLPNPFIFYYFLDLHKLFAQEQELGCIFKSALYK